MRMQWLGIVYIEACSNIAKLVTDIGSCLPPKARSGVEAEAEQTRVAVFAGWRF